MATINPITPNVPMNYFKTNTGEVLNPFVINWLARYLHDGHILSFESSPEDYSIDEPLTFEQILLDLNLCNKDKEQLYCYCEDFLVDERSPLSEVILSLLNA